MRNFCEVREDLQEVKGGKELPIVRSNGKVDDLEIT